MVCASSKATWLGRLSYVLLLVAPASFGQAATDKYPTVPASGGSYYQHYTGEIQVARLAAGGRDIPVMVVDEPLFRVRLFWTNPATGQWLNAAVPHGASVTSDDSTMLDATMRMHLQRPWSNRIGLATGDGLVFLAYRRPIVNERLYLHVYRWNAATSRLEALTPSPVAVPVGGLIPGQVSTAGHYLWLGYHAATRRVILLTQLGSSANPAAAPRLAMLTGTVSNDMITGAATGNPVATWRVQTLDTGGYSLDVRQTGSSLTYVHCRSPYSTRFLLPAGMAGMGGVLNRTLSSAGSDFQYEPLVLGAVNLDNDSASTLSETAPGGDNPRLQSLNPLYVTVDRLESVRVIALGFANDPRFGTALTARFEDPVFGKHLLLSGTNGWVRGKLRDNGLMPRIPDPFYAETDSTAPLIFVGEPNVVPSPTFGLRFLPDAFPAFLVGGGEREVEGEKAAYLQFMLHDTLAGALVVNEYEIDPAASELNPRRKGGSSIYDINHGDITFAHTRDEFGSRGADERRAEVGQLGPFTIAAHLDTSLNAAGNVWLSYPGFGPVSGTIGGRLAVDTSRPGTSFYAYTDLGDAGPRVVFKEDFPAPSVPAEAKKLDRAQIAPGITAGLEWVSVVQTGASEPTRLAVFATTSDSIFTVNAISAGYEPQLDSLVQLALPGVPFFAGRSGEIDRTKISDGLAGLQSVARVTGLGQGSSPGALLPVVTLSVDPVVAEAGKPVTLAVSLPAGSTDPIAQVSWNFGDLSAVEAGPATSTTHAYSGPDTFEATATVTLASGGTRSASARLSIIPVVWDVLWKPVKIMNEQLDVPLLERTDTLHLSFSKYDLVYRNDGEGEPRSVTLTFRPEQLSAFRLRGGSSQGQIDYTLGMRVKLEDLKLNSPAAWAISVDSVAVDLGFTRSFTPGILSVDFRGSDPVSRAGTTPGTPTKSVMTLSAKPLSAGWIAPESVKVKASVSTRAVAGILAVLILLGLTGLGALWLAQRAISRSLPFPSPSSIISGLVITAAMSALVFEVIPAAIESVIESRVRTAILEGTDSVEPLSKTLNDEAFGRYGGEGLAEAFAVRAVERFAPAGFDRSLLATGRNRNQDQAWQMVVVTDGRADILVKPSALVPGGRR
jgi:hypothetical protein